MTTTPVETAEYIVRSAADEAIANEEYFGDLDSVVGDGDFGYSLARGFEVVLSQWDTYDRTDAGTFLTGVAMTITSRIGGTSGPLWGTAFLRAGTRLKGVNPVEHADVIAALRSSVEGIKKRGGAELGEKTLLDALVPAIDTLEESFAAGDSDKVAVTKMAATARTAAEATIELEAKRGRAAYTGTRSIGSVDAGAIGVAVLLERIARDWPES